MAGPATPSDTRNNEPNSVGFAPGVPALPPDATPEQKDAHWYRHVYQGDRMPQLTLRAVLMGGILGMLMAASNLYTTLAIGWAFGVAITACVMSFVIWNGLRILTGVSKMSILENACMASTASAAGYATGSTIATMFGALLLLKVPEAGQTNADLRSIDIQPIWVVALFTLCTGLMGVFLAIPLKRQMINHEQLRFPSGVAAAETLRSLYSESKEAVQKAYMLLSGMAVGAVVGIINTPHDTLKFLDNAMTWFKGVLGFEPRLPELVPATGLAQYWGKQAPAFGFEPSVLLLAAGVIVRLRVSLSMLFGSALLYFYVGPKMVELDQRTPGNGWRQEAGQWIFDAATIAPDAIRNIELNGSGTFFRFTTWALWGGTALMVVASLTAVALQWRTVARAFLNLKDTSGTNLPAGHDAGGRGPVTEAELKAVEVPFTWMLLGMVPIGLVMLFVQYVAFDISIWAGAIAVAMSFFLSLVACRATGETDTTPIGAMGKVMQLLFAVFHPGQIVPNLASAGIAANSAIASADLLTDLKTGYLLGANPRRQFLAQFFGVFFGTLAIVPVWFLMVPNKEALEKFAAPSTRQWEAVAKVLTKGIEFLPESARWAIVFGALLGIGLPLLERVLPPKLRTFVPSAMGLGLSWVVPFGSALGFALGAVIGKLWELVHKPSAAVYAIALASGLIAGESLIKAVIAMTATATGLLSSGGTP